MITLDGLLVASILAGMDGNDFRLIGDFNPGGEGFQPQSLVAVLAGNRITISLKLHQGKLVGFHGNQSAALWRINWNGQ